MKTWHDIEVAAQTNPIFQSAVSAVATGRATREEAMIVVALNQADTLKTIMETVAQFATHSVKLASHQ